MKTTHQITLPDENSTPYVEISWRDGELRIECEDDGWGDTETGFGASVGVNLDKIAATKLLKFLKRHIK